MELNQGVGFRMSKDNLRLELKKSFLKGIINEKEQEQPYYILGNSAYNFGRTQYVNCSNWNF